MKFFLFFLLQQLWGDRTYGPYLLLISQRIYQKPSLVVSIMSSRKRSGEDLQDNGRSQRQKTDSKTSTISPIVVNTPLGSIPINQIDKYITKPLDSASLTLDDLKILEARFTSPLTQPFVDAQARLHTAQSRYHRQFFEFASANQHLFGKKITPETAVTQSIRVIVLANGSQATSRPDLQDALLYRATFMLFYGAYNCNGGGNSSGASKKFEEAIKKADLDIDIPALVEMLTAASERHLDRQADRSSIWATYMSRSEENTSRQSDQPRTAVPTTTTGSADLSVDNRVAIKAQTFITSWKDLEQTSDLATFDQIDNVSELNKMKLRNRRGTWMMDKQGSTPASVLLHGPQGSGKSSFVMNWCQFVKGTLIEFNANAKGHLEGLTEQ